MKLKQKCFKYITIALACLWHQQMLENLRVVYAFLILILLADDDKTRQPKLHLWLYLSPNCRCLISASTWRPLETPDVKYYDKGLKGYLKKPNFINTFLAIFSLLSNPYGSLLSYHYPLQTINPLFHHCFIKKTKTRERFVCYQSISSYCCFSLRR